MEGQTHEPAISIHALLAESDATQACDTRQTIQFLSTLSLRRATCAAMSGMAKRLDISIHALLAESDTLTAPVPSCVLVFLSTLSLRRATRNRSFPLRSRHNFYPRSPCGERQLKKRNFLSLQIFLSTLSLRRAT